MKKTFTFLWIVNAHRATPDSKSRIQNFTTPLPQLERSRLR